MLSAMIRTRFIDAIPPFWGVFARQRMFHRRSTLMDTTLWRASAWWAMRKHKRIERWVRSIAVVLSVCKVL